MELPIERYDAENWLQENKDIWNHPVITDRNETSGYEVADLMAEFANHVVKIAQSEQLVSFLRQYQKACEIMHVNKIDAKNFVEQYKTN